MDNIAEILTQLDERLGRIEAALGQNGGPILKQEWFSVAEAASLLGKASFTVREYARLGRINALKRPSGRGRASEWMISRNEIERVLNKGLLPQICKTGGRMGANTLLNCPS